MKELIRQLDLEYGFKLSEEEVELIAKQWESADRMFQRLNDVDLAGVSPVMKVDKRAKGIKKVKKVKR
jgi:Asp-tRNA(Asn)/Glu-tRNA(Gln) amidotransferase C subunit